MADESVHVIEICNSSSPEEKVSIRSLHDREQIKILEQEEDCFILEFNPNEELQLSRVSFSGELDDGEAELVVVAEKGQVVACRDYPHPRHTCIAFPFEKTPHRSHCEQCFCCVCDTAAPCSSWVGTDSHCDAFDNEMWRLEKKAMKAREIHID